MFRFIALIVSALSGFSALAAGNDHIFALEKQIGGRVGVMAIDTGTGQQLAYRSGERFAMCSTFKLLLVAQILHRVDEGKEKLDRAIPYDRSDLESYSPITSKHAEGKGMTVAELCAAAIQYSDNTAANLLLKTQGGPKGLTEFARFLRDGEANIFL